MSVCIVHHHHQSFESGDRPTTWAYPITFSSLCCIDADKFPLFWSGLGKLPNLYVLFNSAISPTITVFVSCDCLCVATVPSHDCVSWSSATSTHSLLLALCFCPWSHSSAPNHCALQHSLWCPHYLPSSTLSAVFFFFRMWAMRVFDPWLVSALYINCPVIFSRLVNLPIYQSSLFLIMFFFF